jgi:DNA-binding transcriptional MerR regulator
MTSENRYPLDHLARLSGVPERQIRELVRLRLLPAPSSQGRGATYGTEHLDRLRTWKALRSRVPSSTTNDQLRILLNKLSDKGLLRVIAEGKIPFDLIDDQKQDVTIGVAESTTGLVARLSREPALSPDEQAAESQRTNQEALAYLSSLRGVPRLVMPSVQRASARGHARRRSVRSNASARALAVRVTRLRRYACRHGAGQAAGDRDVAPRHRES